mmetsp:Transcript_91403/g.244752  ORF Transcript_91403/g.244752 Transcript_91403/m.244752 type:complete len:503 (-) Transcript_91403:104-1612(-)
MFGRVAVGIYFWCLATGQRGGLPTPTVPFCRKAPVVTALRDAASPDDLDLFVWSGKGHDWTQHRIGSVFLDDSWEAGLGPSWLRSFGGFRYLSWARLGTAGGSPAGRWKSAGSATVDGTAVVMFGGDTGQEVTQVQNDLWVMRPGDCDAKANSIFCGSWQERNFDNPPIPRRGHVAVATKEHFVVMGGKTVDPLTGESVCTRDVWRVSIDGVLAGAVNGTVPRWEKMQDFPGTCRWGHSGSYFNVDGRELMVVYGGRIKSSMIDPNTTNTTLLDMEGHRPHKSAYTYFRSVWAYDTAADTWEPLNLQPEPAEAHTKHHRHRAVRPVAPEARDHHSATGIGGTLWVFSGRVNERREPSSDRNDIWSFDIRNRTWTGYNPAGEIPLQRYLAGMATVTQNGTSVLAMFGGEHFGAALSNGKLNDIWLFYPPDSTTKAGRWEQVGSVACHAGATGAVLPGSVTSMALVPGPGAGGAIAVFAICALGFLVWQRARGTGDQEGYAVLV